MSLDTRVAASLAELARHEGKAELIGERIVPLMPTGRRSNLIAGRIYRSLAAHVDGLSRGEVYTDNMGFAVPELSSGRQTFSPEVSYYEGPFPADDMRFIEGPPTFAVQVRSDGDYGPAAEVEMASKRSDYFEVGTRLVWDVDPIAKVVRAYRPADPGRAETHRPDGIIDAEPEVPGWIITIEEIFG